MNISMGRRLQVRHRCVKCHRLFPHSFTTFCDCGGMIDVEYDMKNVVFYDSANPLERFFDLLPIEDPLILLPQEMKYTPCVHARKIGAYLGMPNLYLKNETVLPTGTTKYRMAVVSLAYLAECGVRVFCTSSTGNSSTAYASAINRYPGLRLYLFTAENFRDRVQYEECDQVTQFVLREASFVEAFNFAGKFALRNGLVSERGFFNPGRREGLKLTFLEAAEQVPQPIDWYVQGISSAMGVYGNFKGAKELLMAGRIHHLPRLLCVQQETCSPMVKAFEDSSEVIRPEHIFHKPTGIAKAILRGDPTRAYPHIRKIVLESNGSFVAVSEQQVREARRMVEEYEGISPCFSASAALAGLVLRVRRGDFPANDTVLVNLTGSDRPYMSLPKEMYWLHPSGNGWWVPDEPEDDFLRSLLWE